MMEYSSLLLSMTSLMIHRRRRNRNCSSQMHCCSGSWWKIWIIRIRIIKLLTTTECTKFISAISFTGFCNQYHHNSNDNNRISISRTIEICYSNSSILMNVGNDIFGNSNTSITGCQLLQYYCHQIIHPELCANSVVLAGNAWLGSQANC